MTLIDKVKSKKISLKKKRLLGAWNDDFRKKYSNVKNDWPGNKPAN